MSTTATNEHKKTSAGSATSTIGKALAANAGIDQAIDRAVNELIKAQSQINAVRGPVNESLAADYKKLLDHASKLRGKSKLFFDYHGSGIGNGPFVELADGSVKLDLICGIGPMFFGHSDPEVTRAVLRSALSDMILQGNLQMNEDSTQFCELLVEQASRTSRLEHVFLSNSGCMVNEAALKICYQKSNAADRVIAFENCFMGRSVTMSQLGDNAANRVGVPLTTLVDYVPFYDAQRGEESIAYSLKRLDEYIERYPGQHACFVFELVQGEGGFNPAPRAFFTALMQRCKEHNISVWIDEVQTFGRTGEMFAFELMGLGQYVDICTIGKMSQVCACLYTADLNPKPGLLSGTFIGTSVALGAGLYMLKKLRDGGYYGDDGIIARHHARFIEGIHEIARRHPEWFGPIRDAHGNTLTTMDICGGLGGMMRFTPFGGDKTAVNKLMYTLFDQGVISFYCGHGPYHIRFLPPLGVMKLDQWNAAFEVLERALRQTAGELKIG